MATRKSTRGKKHHDFKKVNSQGFSSEEDNNDELLQLATDPQGEKDLCGSEVESQMSESDIEELQEEMEEGQISESEDESEDEIDPSLQKYAEEGNLQKLKQFLKKQEDDNKKLRITLERQKQKERAKSKEIKAVLEQIQRANKTKSSLQKSLATSRNSSRNCSPVATPNSTKARKPKSDQRKVIRKSTNKGTKKNNNEGNNNSEYSDTLLSLLKIKQGSNDSYASLVEKAMDATDSILELKSTREGKNKREEIQKTQRINNDGSGNIPGLDDLISIAQAEKVKGKVNNSDCVHTLVELLKEAKVNKSDCVPGEPATTTTIDVQEQGRGFAKNVK